MDISNALSAIRVVYDCLIKGKPDFALIPPHPTKTALLLPMREPFFPSARPQRVGVDGERLLAFARTLSESRVGNVHAVTVLSQGKCVFEAAKAGYSVDMPHAAFSLSKTLTGLAIGMLVDDGKLSPTDPVLSFFPEFKGKRASAKFKSLTLHHLLSMSVNLPFNEIGVAISDTYTKDFFESGLRDKPGEEFAYNSMCSYILAVIVTRVTERSLSEFLDERLFAPMGIHNYFWEKSREGVEKGGWGLYLSVKAMAKLGMLFLNRGEWYGKRLISEKWLTRMTERHTEVPNAIGRFDYGYHLWRHKENGSFLFNGMLGQNVWVYPEKQLVVAITAGDPCLFQDALSLKAALRELLGMTACDTRRARRERREIARHFGEKASLIPPYISFENHEARERLFPALEGRFLLHENNSGVLPLLTRLIQNSPTKGISAITLSPCKKGDGILFSFTEGKENYHIAAGNCRFVYGILTIHGEKYRVAAAYACGLTEEREPYLRLELRFPALASSRLLLIRPIHGKLTLSLTEAPGYEVVENLLKSGVGEKSDLLEFLTKPKSPADFLLRRIKAAFAPTLRMIPESDAHKAKKT